MILVFCFSLPYSLYTLFCLSPLIACCVLHDVICKQFVMSVGHWVALLLKDLTFLFAVTDLKWGNYIAIVKYAASHKIHTSFCFELKLEKWKDLIWLYMKSFHFKLVHKYVLWHYLKINLYIILFPLSLTGSRLCQDSRPGTAAAKMSEG